MASAIITEATPRKKRRNLGWRRAANDRGAVMVVGAGGSWAGICCKKEMVRPGALRCPACGLTLQVEAPARGQRAECPRCGSTVSEGPHGSLQVTAALAIAALILYIPANIYPILRMHFYGAFSESTVWDGVVSLAQTRQYFVALIVFMASIVIPILKLAGLLYLVVSARFGVGRRLHGRTRIYRFIDVIGQHRDPDPQARRAAIPRRQRPLRRGAAPARPHSHLSLHRRHRPLGDARRLPAGDPRCAGEARADRHHPARAGAHCLYRGGGPYHARLG